MSTCLKTTDHLYTQVPESTDCSSSSCPPSASSEEFAPEGYLILTFDKAKRAKLKTAIFADVSDCRFADDFDDDDDNPIEDDLDEPVPPWTSHDNSTQSTLPPPPPSNQSASGLSPDSACHSTSTVHSDHAILASTTACYGEAVWVGENGCTTNSGEEFTDERVALSSGDKTASSGTQSHSLIRTSPIVLCTTRSPGSGLSPVKSNDLSTKRTVVLRCAPSSVLMNGGSQTPSPSSGFSDTTSDTISSHPLPFRSSNRLLTPNSGPNSVNSAGRFLPSAHQSSLYSRSRFHTGSVDWRHHSIHGRNCGKMLRCEACGKYYRNEYSLDHHICLKRKDVWKKGDVPSKIIDGQVVFFCPTCHKPFKWLGNLTRHYYVHTGQRFFKCDICPKEFFSAYQVRRHMNSHTGVRFKCEVCEKPFTCKYACAWHTRQHYTYVE
ncbi:unnamed protein product [Echinostoma caproni]|uniref:Zinc finger protein n=1 Tax=Echinostoma caproni TaxID=27848 RepID=A0A183APX5_9TREM|nr:unnamed protein product [Echinostoma caproni]